jgi:hypothetical protein
LTKSLIAGSGTRDSDRLQTTAATRAYNDSQFENARGPTFVERVRAEGARLKSEETYHTLFNPIDQGLALRIMPVRLRASLTQPYVPFYAVAA